MRVWGFDPGGTMGVAIIDATPMGDVTIIETTYMPHYQFPDWYQVYLNMHAPAYPHDHRPHIVTEDFLGAGPVSADGRLTIQMVGYIHWTAKALTTGGRVLSANLANPDNRLCMNNLAIALIRAKTGEAPERNQQSAMAHALAYVERKGINVRR